jgi:hypothetical protein
MNVIAQVVFWAMSGKPAPKLNPSISGSDKNEEAFIRECVEPSRLRLECRMLTLAQLPQGRA